MVMLEPRASDKVDFDSIMKHFYEVISEHGDQGENIVSPFPPEYNLAPPLYS